MSARAFAPGAAISTRTADQPAAVKDAASEATRSSSVGRPQSWANAAKSRVLSTVILPYSFDAGTMGPLGGPVCGA